jgi:predicted MFS family arabinose efflux permease
MVQSLVVTLAADKKGLSPRLTAAFNATAFNIGISAATFTASGIVATKGVLALPFAAALAVIASLPLLLSSRRRIVLNVSA